MGFTLLPVLAACAGDDERRLGAVLPLSGDAAVYGEAVRDGMTLAAEQLVAEDAATAPKLTVSDSAGDPQRAAEQLERLFDDGATAAIAGVTDAEALAAARVADDAGHVVMSPSAASPELSGASRWFFRVRPSGVHEANRMALFARRELGLDRVAVVAPAGPPEGTAGAFVKAFTAQDGEVVAELAYDPAGDLTATAREAAGSGAQAVYLDGPAPALEQLIAALDQAGFRGRVLTNSSFSVPAVLESAGRDAEGVLVSRPIFDADSADPAVRAFATAFEERFGREPGLFEAYGYDAVRTLARAMEGGTSPAAVWKGLHGLQDYRGASGHIQFDERGEVIGFPRVYVVRKGELAEYGAGARPASEQLAAAPKVPATSRVGG